MKKLELWRMIMVASLILSLMIACGSDNDGKNNNNDTNIAITGTCVEVGSDYALVEGFFNNNNMTGSSSTLQVGVEYSMEESFRYSTFAKTNVIEGNKFEVKIKNLKDSTVYYYRTCVIANTLHFVGKTGKFTTLKSSDDFDPDIYKEIITKEFPIDPVDDQQQWNLTARRVATITVPSSAKDARRLMVLTDDPTTNHSATIMAETSKFSVGSNVLVFAAPEIQTTFYAALEQTDGSLLIKSFTASDSRVSMADATNAAKPQNTLGYQTFTYCFEENYPEPGDYDFNDCVLRVSLQPGEQTNQRKLNVSMVATGADKLIGAAINILNYKYSDIESVVEQDGKMWDEGYPARRYLMDNEATFQEGRNGEAVIRLFENASWIMVHNQTDDVGALINYKVNVTETYSESTRQINPTTKTYVITFKESATALLNNFSLLNIDPFIVTYYNSGKWETHTYSYKHSNILFEGVTQDSGNMTWALCIPAGDFRWPLEGVIIGTKKGGLITGAYRENAHAFGSWAAKRTTARDWYLYPTVTSVY